MGDFLDYNVSGGVIFCLFPPPRAGTVDEVLVEDEVSCAQRSKSSSRGSRRGARLHPPGARVGPWARPTVSPPRAPAPARGLT